MTYVKFVWGGGRVGQGPDKMTSQAKGDEKTTGGGTSLMDGLLLIASFLRSSDWKCFLSDVSGLRPFSTIKYKRSFRPSCACEFSKRFHS